LQVHLYYTKYCGRDRWAMKSLVAILWTLDTLHLVILVILLYHYTVTNWGDVVVLGLTTWSLKIQILIGTIITLVVQCFFAFRIWRLSGKNWVLAGAIVILSLIQLGFGTAVCMVHFFQESLSTTDSKGDKFRIETGLSSDIACDLVITASMVYYLQKSRTGFKGTNQMINMLITYTIRTCLLTTLCTLSSLITFLVFPDALIYAAFYFIACRLYANSFLSTLNARESIVNINPGSDMISLGRVAGTGPYSTNDGLVTVVIGSDKCSPSEAHCQSQRGSGVYDSKAKLSV